MPEDTILTSRVSSSITGIIGALPSAASRFTIRHDLRQDLNNSTPGSVESLKDRVNINMVAVKHGATQAYLKAKKTVKIVNGTKPDTKPPVLSAIKKSQSEQDILKSTTSRLNAANKGRIINSSFGELLKLNEADLLSGEVYNPEELAGLMPLGFLTLQSKAEDKEKLLKNQKPLVPIGKKLATPAPANFFQDYQILIDRQNALEIEALSSLSYKYSETRSICRYGRSDVAILAWNAFCHLRSMRKRIIRKEISFEIYSIIKLPNTEVHIIKRLAALFQDCEKNEILELKAMIGHLKRIALVSMENKAGSKQLIKGLANLTSAMLIDIEVLEISPVYISPLLELSRAVLLDGSSEDILNLIPIPLNSSTQKAYLVTNPAVPPKVTENLRVQIAPLRSDLELSWESLEGTTTKELLFQLELALTWHAAAIDLMIRYWDYLFKV